MIGAIAISVGALFVSGHLGLPYLSMIAPDPVISGYIGFYAGMIALTIVPLIVLIKIALNFIWGYRSSYRYRAAMTGVWVVSFTVFIITVAFTSRNFIYQTSMSETVSEASISPDTPLHINVDQPAHNDNIRLSFGPAYLTEGSLFNRDGVSMRFVPTEEDRLKITKTIRSRGMNKRTAERNASYPSHNLSLTENNISLDDYYKLGKKDKYRAQRYSYEVAVPLGTQLSISESSHIFRHKELRHGSNAEDKMWIMTEDGLQSVEEG